MNVKKQVVLILRRTFIMTNLQMEIKKNRVAEVILLQVLQSIVDDKYFIEDVADNEECYHLGDVKVTDRDGNIAYYDAKNDGVIHKTGRVFCESHKYFFNTMKKHTGFMEDGNYDYLSVVDRVDKKIYILDFKILKSIYKDYKEVQTTLKDCYSYGTVIPLDECRREKALVYTINYDGDDSCYYALDVINEQGYSAIRL